MARIEINKKTRKQLEVKENVTMLDMYKILLIMPCILMGCAFLFNSPSEILEGIKNIHLADDVLITDYLLVANIGASFINASVIMFLNIALLYYLKLKPNGGTISALFLLGGFAFMGKNLLNIWPFYLGGYIYSRYHRIPYKNVVVINMLSTALSPLSSVLTQSIEDNILLSLALTGLVSGFIGFVMPPISTHMLNTHLGYSLYNMGIATGIIGIVVYSVMMGQGMEIERHSLYYELFDLNLLMFFAIYCLALVVIGFFINGKSFKGYKKLMKHRGRLVTDTIKQDGFGLSLINMGVLGIISLLYIYLIGGVLNGPVIAAMMTVIGFGGFGKHPKNILPIMLGVTIGFVLMGQEHFTSALIISALFGTTLAPIAGEYGIIWGTLAGILHAAVVLNTGGMHGGLALYNNGLAGGIVAMVLVPLIDAFKRET